MSDALQVAIVSGIFGLIAIPVGLYLKRHFDLQDRREADEEADRRECIRARQAYHLAMEQLRGMARHIVAMQRLKETGEDAAFELGWAQLQERATSMEFDFAAMVDPEAMDERRHPAAIED